MAPKPKRTDNEEVSDWLIRTRWANNLNVGTKQQLPTFVEDAVMASIYIVAGTSNGKVNISPKLVCKALMLRTISTEDVQPLEIGYDLSQRQARRLAQTARFALDGIRRRIQEYENSLSEDEVMNRKAEWGFVMDYYNKKESKLYTPPCTQPLPDSILQLYKDKKYLEYGQAVGDFRRIDTVGVYKSKLQYTEE